mmetsp:Transcript_116/g.485  ORF Transcript_116/g.485 Transcript_116/m.485 type:complete len:358 (-) Transcript_116:323-1396(-)
MPFGPFNAFSATSSCSFASTSFSPACRSARMRRPTSSFINPKLSRASVSSFVSTATRSSAVTPALVPLKSSLFADNAGVQAVETRSRDERCSSNRRTSSSRNSVVSLNVRFASINFSTFATMVFTSTNFASPFSARAHTCAAVTFEPVDLGLAPDSLRRLRADREPPSNSSPSTTTRSITTFTVSLDICSLRVFASSASKNARTASPAPSPDEGAGEYTPSASRINVALAGIATPEGTLSPTRTSELKSIAARHVNTSSVFASAPAAARAAVSRTTPKPRFHARGSLALRSPIAASSPPVPLVPYTQSSNFTPQSLPSALTNAPPSPSPSSNAHQSGLSPRPRRSAALVNENPRVAS